ncbi:MAG: hypothetical protein ACKOQW_06335 [Phycisphaerales bacterium]
MHRAGCALHGKPRHQRAQPAVQLVRARLVRGQRRQQLARMSWTAGCAR